MTEERKDYMRRQEADHDLLRMRDPSVRVGRFTSMVEPKVITLYGHPLTDRMKLFGVTGMRQTLGGGWDIQTATGSSLAPHEVALWFMERS